MSRNLMLVSFLFVFIACSMFITITAHSAGIKERMADRLPRITALKDKGGIGEDNGGYLAFRGGDKSGQAVVNDENKDRTQVYTAIGKQQGAPAKLVGERRAKMIRDNGPAGHWYQKPDGSWYKK